MIPGILFLLSGCLLNMPPPWLESTLAEPQKCPSCPSLIASMDPHHCCFKCLRLEVSAENSATNASQCPLLPPFVTQNAMEVLLSEEDDIFSSVSVSSASPKSVAPTLVRHHFPSLMTIAAGDAGWTLPPLLLLKPVNWLREGFYGLKKASIPLTSHSWHFAVCRCIMAPATKE